MNRIALLCITWLGVAYAAPAVPRLPSAVLWLVNGANGAPGVYATTPAGDLFTWQAGQVRLLEKTFALSPLIACGEVVAGINAQGELRSWSAGRLNTTSGAGLSPLSRPACVAQGLVAVAKNGDLARYEARAGVWREVARVQADALADAQLTLADLTGSGTPQLVVLTGPDGARYTHGVLGDALEATGIAAYDQTSLQVRGNLKLSAPFVFEDLEARPLRTTDARDVLVVVRSSPRDGAALAFIEQDASALKIRSLGPAFGQPNRWLAPVVGRRVVWAVHTPHLGGVLHRYQERDGVLTAALLQKGVSNHIIGSRNLNMAVMIDEHQLVLPSQDRRRLLIMRCASRCVVQRELPLDAPLSSNLVISAGHLIAGDESGRLYRWSLAGF